MEWGITDVLSEDDGCHHGDALVEQPLLNVDLSCRSNEGDDTVDSAENIHAPRRVAPPHLLRNAERRAGNVAKLLHFVSV